MNVEYSNNSDLVVKFTVQIKLAPPVAVSVGQGCGIRGVRALGYRRLPSVEFLNNLYNRRGSLFHNSSVVCNHIAVRSLYGPDGPGFESRKRKEFFLFSKIVLSRSGAH